MEQIQIQHIQFVVRKGELFFQKKNIRSIHNIDIVKRASVPSAILTKETRSPGGGVELVHPPLEKSQE